MKVRLLEVAEIELDEAIDWYRAQVQSSVIPTGAERSEAKWRDLFY